MTAPGPARVYARTGKIAHLLPCDASPSLGYAFTFCRRQPRLFASWLGTGSQAEYEKAGSLPLCSRCEHLSAKSPDLPAAAAITAAGTEIPVPSPASPGGTGAKPAEPAPPSGGAGSAPEGTDPRGPSAPAGLPSPTPEGSPAPGPAGEGRIGGASPAARRSWTVELPAGLEVLSLNGREHRMVRYRKGQVLEDAAIVMTRKAKVPRLERIHVTVLFDPPDRRERDHDNLSPTYKHLADGIVKAGVVPDDTPQYMVPGRCEVTGTVFPRGRLRMIITDLGGEAA